MTQYIAFLGAPGSGKGTQTARLGEYLNLPRIATGELIRSHLATGTVLGNKARKFVETGKLVPDSLINEIFEYEVTPELVKKGVIFDGYPRTVEQAEAFEKLFNHRSVRPKVFYLEVSKDALLNRIQGRKTCLACNIVYHDTFNPPKTKDTCDRCGGKLVQRDDDKAETVLNRYALFQETIAPMERYFGNDLIRINGDLSPERVFEQIKVKLELR